MRDVRDERVEELLTSAAAARVLKRTPDTVRLWRRQRKITPAALTPSGIALYRRADLERLRRR
jgi:DNA-binding transcriptional MerR regulator